MYDKKLQKLLEKTKLEARMNEGLADKIQRLLETSEGDVILIDNFIAPELRESGVPDNTYIGYFKSVIPCKIALGGTSDTEPSGNDIGVVVEFEKSSKILEFGGREYDLPDRLKEREFYKKAKPRFVDNPEMRGTVHYNSNMIRVLDERDRKFADNWLLQHYETSLEEAGF